MTPEPGTALGAALHAALGVFAARERVLVAADFDGTLAPLVEDPAQARALPAARRALAQLAAAPGVQVALVSGRALADLQVLADPPPDAVLVGSHGAEVHLPGGADRRDLPRVDTDLLRRVRAALEDVAGRHPGTGVEVKPTSAVLHTRSAPRAEAEAATRQALAGPATWPGVHLTRGKEVVELAVTDATKGAALTALRPLLALPPRGGILYTGDDVTDERAFAALDDDAGDVTVKVGPGETLARHRVDDPGGVADLLALLVRMRPG